MPRFARITHDVVIERVPPTAKKKGEVARGRLPSLLRHNGRCRFVRLHMLQAKSANRLFGRAPSFFAGRADEEVAHEMGRWVRDAYAWAFDVHRRQR
jgi:hypothetical protein